MLPVNLTAAQMPAYHAALDPDLLMRPSLDVLDMRQRFVRTIGPESIVEGQVDFHDAAVRRSLAVTFDEDDPQLGFNTDTPWAGSAVLLQAWSDVWVPDLETWARVPMGRYKPSAPSDAGGAGLNQMEAQDKACLHLRATRQTTIRAGSNRVEAIRSGLQAAGETLFNFPPPNTYTGKVAVDTPVGGPDEENQPWKVWTALADAEGLDLLHDGLGRPWLRPKADAGVSASWDEASLTAAPATTTDLTQLINALQGTSKTGTKFYELLRADQAGSPREEAFGGVDWETWAFENPDVSDAAMPGWVTRQLANRSQQTRAVNLAGMPRPHVEPGDWGSTQWRGVPLRFRVDTGSVPLTPGLQTVGFTARTATLKGAGVVRVPKPRARRRRR